ncbi:hypothetical protein A2U01_0085989, partial [Trifolium medium]|nr:hypothetical protein [Trifolium medium]
QHCAPRQHQLHVAQTPEGKMAFAPKQCASHQRPKPNRLPQQERRVAPDASARRARGRKWGNCG